MNNISKYNSNICVHLKTLIDSINSCGQSMVVTTQQIKNEKSALCLTEKDDILSQFITCHLLLTLLLKSMFVGTEKASKLLLHKFFSNPTNFSCTI